MGVRWLRRRRIGRVHGTEGEGGGGFIQFIPPFDSGKYLELDLDPTFRR